MRRLILAGAILTLVFPNSAAAIDDSSDGRSDAETRIIQVSDSHNVPGLGTRPVGGNILQGCVFRANLTGQQVVTYGDQRHITHKPSIDFYNNNEQAAEGEEGAEGEESLYHLAVCNRRLFGNRYWTAWPITEPIPQIFIDPIALHAYNSIQIPLPTPKSSPPGTRNHPLITQLETWYWTDPTLWQPLSATAAIPEFGFSVTVTATPTTSEWDPGDGTPPTTCEAGTEWTLGAGDYTPCSHTYSQTTQHDGTSTPYPLTVTITWATNYVCVPATRCTGPPRVPGQVVTQITREVLVTEIKGLLTR